MSNTATQVIQQDKLDREAYLRACRDYTAATSAMDAAALAQLAIAAVFAGMQIGEQNKLHAHRKEHNMTPNIREVRVNPEMQFTTDDLCRMLFGKGVHAFAEEVRNDTTGQYEFLREDNKEEANHGRKEETH